MNFAPKYQTSSHTKEANTLAYVHYSCIDLENSDHHSSCIYFFIFQIGCKQIMFAIVYMSYIPCPVIRASAFHEDFPRSNHWHLQLKASGSSWFHKSLPETLLSLCQPIRVDNSVFDRTTIWLQIKQFVVFIYMSVGWGIRKPSFLHRHLQLR